MIGIRLEGRLGNQLFQYAFVYATAKKLSTKFYIDSSIDFFRLPMYFELSKTNYLDLELSIFSVKGYKNIFSYHLKKVYYLLIPKIFSLHTIQVENLVPPEQELDKIKNFNFYLGFFQSEKYFSEKSKEIKELFKIKNSYKKQFLYIKNNLPKNRTQVVVHVRRGDYVGLGLTLPLEYFHQTIKKVQEENTFFIFLSDDPNFVNIEFDYIDQKYISKHSEIIDFQFIMNADICILSNSSFSWWGAYLNNKQPKIFAPKNWLGIDTELPNSIIPDSWTKV